MNAGMGNWIHFSWKKDIDPFILRSQRLGFVLHGDAEGQDLNSVVIDLGPLLLIWFNFNPSMDK